MARLSRYRCRYLLLPLSWGGAIIASDRCSFCSGSDNGCFSGVVVFGDIIGTTLKLSFVWLLADTLNAMMAIPNLIALALLSPIVFKITRDFFESRGESENNPF
ncbi:MAG: alanine:cation symporter family protein [Candidatus Oxydemutatoraceae bacterium WSBS_2016_MAG_OTU14]